LLIYSDLEKLLRIFDRENRTKNEPVLNVDEDSFPERYRPLIRRLRMASESEDIQIEMEMEMEMEDDILKELQDKERFIAQQRKTIEEKNKALEEKDKTIEALKEQLAKIQQQK
jgi:hypothetical protein